MTAAPSSSAPSSPSSPTFTPIQTPLEVVERVYGKSSIDQPGVKLITLAPDVEGVMDCVANLSERGVTVSIGHSDATLDVAVEAVEKGARMITHLFK
jgi:N-acetylglucosamine-6-phosphate deacetylase